MDVGRWREYFFDFSEHERLGLFCLFFYSLIFRRAKMSPFAVCRFVSCFSTLQFLLLFPVYTARSSFLDSSSHTTHHTHSRVIHERRIALHSRTHSARAKTHAKNKFAYARAPEGARKTCANDICILLFVICITSHKQTHFHGHGRDTNIHTHT